MAEDSVYVDPQQASNGLAQWDAGSAPLKSGWTETVAAIQALNTPATWGSDGPGEEFAGGYTEGADQFLTVGGEVVDQVVQLGVDSRTAVERSIASDEVQAGHVTVEVEGLP
ncbi:hypothetical protein [Modestobacter sp. Leaf380]|uniref:hypothetical protein n=1 Tax=Modestobacter sp. Leaf380 TaxID=1736356 RepID=UPI0012FC3364|nr:hypothetical protein [Modestobacter sp. Leaf380]